MARTTSVPKRLDGRAVERIEGPAFETFRPVFFELANTLLGQAPSTESELTTIYVKFRTAPLPDGRVFAVAWLKNSRQLLVGLSVPEGFVSPSLIDPPRGYVYKGLTKYVRIAPEDGLPDDIDAIAAAAFKAESS